MTEPWSVVPTNGDFRRVGYRGKDYEFTYQDVIKQFDYFRGYIDKQQYKVPVTNVSNEYNSIVKEHNYARRMPLPPPILSDKQQKLKLKWEDVTTKEGWDYIPPEQLSAVEQCREEIDDLSDRLSDTLRTQAEMMDMVEMVLLESARCKELLNDEQAMKEATRNWLEILWSALETAGITEQLPTKSLDAFLANPDEVALLKAAMAIKRQ